MANNSLEDKNVKMLLVVVVVGLVIYLLVSYLNGNGICGSPPKEGFHNKDELLQDISAHLEDADTTPEPKSNSMNNVQGVGEDLDGVADDAAYFEQPIDVEGEEEIEGFQNSEPQASDSTTSTNEEVVQSNNANSNTNAPTECYPKDVLSSGDLLPNDANSKWAQVNPNGQGALGDKNFLNAGYHVGVNTVGQSLRNANRQLRSDPPNPQVKVSPWMQTTIEPDVNRKPMEIGA